MRPTKKLFVIELIFLILITPSICNAYVQTNWEKKIDATYLFSIQQTSDKGYIMVGNLGTSGDNEDVILIKTNASGEQEWVKSFDSSKWESGYSVKETQEGGLIISGRRVVYVQPDEKPLKSQILIIKTDPSGNTLWEKTYGGFAEDAGRKILETDDRGFILIDSRGCLWKIDENGRQIWNNTLSGCIEGWDIQPTKDGGYIVTGEPMGLTKLDENGTEEWSKTLPGIGYAVREINDGYVVAGVKEGNVSVLKTDPYGEFIWHWKYDLKVPASGRSLILTSDGGFMVLCLVGYVDSYILKLDESGHLVWREFISNNAGFSLLEADNDSFIIAGTKLGNYQYLDLPPEIEQITGPLIEQDEQNTSIPIPLLFIVFGLLISLNWRK